MSNEMNSIPVKDSKGNITGISDVDGNDLISALLAKILISAPDGLKILPGERDLGTEVSKKDAAELNRWFRKNYPMRSLGGDKLPTIREAQKILEKYQRGGGADKIKMPYPSRWGKSSPVSKLPGKHPGNIIPGRDRPPVNVINPNKGVGKSVGISGYKPGTVINPKITNPLMNLNRQLTSRGGIPGASPLSALLYLLVGSKGIVKGGRNLAESLLGLNETEYWRNPEGSSYELNPEGSSYEQESYDHTMDPNSAMRSLLEQIDPKQMQ